MQIPNADTPQQVVDQLTLFAMMKNLEAPLCSYDEGEGRELEVVADWVAIYESQLDLLAEFFGSDREDFKVGMPGTLSLSHREVRGDCKYVYVNKSCFLRLLEGYNNGG